MVKIRRIYIIILLPCLLLLSLLYTLTFVSNEDNPVNDDDTMANNVLENLNAYMKKEQIEDYSLIYITVVRAKDNSILENHVVFNDIIYTTIEKYLEKFENQSYILTILINKSNMLLLFFNENNEVVISCKCPLDINYYILNKEKIPDFQMTIVFLWSIIDKLDDDEFSKKDISTMCLVSKSELINSFDIKNEAIFLWDNYVLIKYNLWYNFSNFAKGSIRGLDGSKFIVIPVPICDVEALSDSIEISKFRMPSNQRISLPLHLSGTKGHLEADD